MKRCVNLLLSLLLIVSLCCCSADTYTSASTSRTFKLKNVASITLSGPDGETQEGTQVIITPDSGLHYTRLVQMIEGEKLTECETKNFGLCYISFTFTTGETTKIYPANDGSDYLCLYSLNPATAKYLKLSEDTMDELISIFESYKIQVIYQ